MDGENNGPGNPFINVPVLVEVAKRAQADAVHPGYGYLSENTDFADAIRDAGITFIGPSSQAILTLGDKRQSKEYLREHCPSVPLIPGFAGRSQELDSLERAAEGIGYPVMIKASAGGGGKGIRIIHAKDQLRSNMEMAQSEARRSFGSSDCILEKYIERGKHVEVQIIGDRHGNVISLFERECSVQRRHQKIIEESPCLWLPQEMRIALCNAACDIGRLVGYEGAGTVEFIVDVDSVKFYFLEVNSRIQVEHPITEEVTGIDIVALQLAVAAGADLTAIQLPNPTQTGHAIECRLCAENPQQGFLPELGTIYLWRPSIITEDVRYETAIVSGTVLNMSFDPMIAKIVVWAPNRESAIRKMVSVLASTACVGLTTNQAFLQSCLVHPGFQARDYTTSFIERNLGSLLKLIPVESLAVIQSAIIAMTATYLETCKPAASSFDSIGKRFRNQNHDEVNALSQLMVINQKAFPEEALRSPILHTWVLDKKNANVMQPQMYQIQLALLFDQVQSLPGYNELSASAKLVAMYNALSNLMRKGVVDRQQAIRVVNLSSKIIDQEKSGSSDLVVELAAEVKGSRITGSLVILNAEHVSSTGSDVAQPQRLLFHSPLLGTWFSFDAFDILSYFESLRAASVAGVGSADDTSIKAPMPCKVLRLVKRSGDLVKKGETVLIIESMKMEMVITVAQDGKLKCELEEGQSLEEGAVLCTVA